LVYGSRKSARVDANLQRLAVFFEAAHDPDIAARSAGRGGSSWRIAVSCWRRRRSPFADWLNDFSSVAQDNGFGAPPVSVLSVDVMCSGCPLQWHAVPANRLIGRHESQLVELSLSDQQPIKGVAVQ
jgi:hypothetical protein